MEAIIGCYTEKGNPGLIRIREEDGRLTRTAEYGGVENPTFVCISPDRHTLYAGAEMAGTAEGEQCCVVSLDFGRFTPVASCLTKGHRPCHVSLSGDYSRLFAANYAEGSFSVYDVSDGGIRLLQTVPHVGRSVNKERQAGPHAHQATQLPGTNVVNVVDLGMDAILSYIPDTDSGLYREFARTSVEPGYGPRHLAYAEDGVTAYLCHELGNRVSVLRWNGNGFDTLQTLETLPAGFSGFSACAAVKVAGDRVYISNRGHDSIARYRVAKDGLLRPDGIYPTVVSFPRDFAVLPDGSLLVAGQFGGGVKKLRWDGAGYVEAASLDVFAPVCVQLL